MLLPPAIASLLKWARYLAAFLAGGLLLLLLLFGLLIWQRPWIPYIFDYGPFAGRPAGSIPAAAPVATYSVGEFALASYAPPNPGDAPVVVLRDSKGAVKWAVHAEGREQASVSSVSFVDHRTLWHTTVRGRVTWSYGNEVCWWIIDRSGNLVAYYYGW